MMVIALLGIILKATRVDLGTRADQRAKGPPKKWKDFIPSLKVTKHLKMDDWNSSFLLGWPFFRGNVSFRQGVK